MAKKQTSMPGSLPGAPGFVPLTTTLPSTATQPGFLADSLPFKITSDEEDASQIPYTPSNPADWSPAPTTVAEALDQLAARPHAPLPVWYFASAPPLSGEGWYVTGTQTVSRALASAAAGDIAADATGVSTGNAGELVTTYGAECNMRLEPGLTGADAPVPGSILYTSWTTAGLFTTIPPPALSGDFQAYRGKCVDASAYDPSSPSGSVVRALFLPLYVFGPV